MTMGVNQLTHRTIPLGLLALVAGCSAKPNTENNESTGSVSQLPIPRTFAPTLIRNAQRHVIRHEYTVRWHKRRRKCSDPRCLRSTRATLAAVRSTLHVARGSRSTLLGTGVRTNRFGTTWWKYHKPMNSLQSGGSFTVDSQGRLANGFYRAHPLLQASRAPVAHLGTNRLFRGRPCVHFRHGRDPVPGRGERQDGTARRGVDAKISQHAGPPFAAVRQASAPIESSSIGVASRASSGSETGCSSAITPPVGRHAPAGRRCAHCDRKARDTKTR